MAGQVPKTSKVDMLICDFINEGNPSASPWRIVNFYFYFL